LSRKPRLRFKFRFSARVQRCSRAFSYHGHRIKTQTRILSPGGTHTRISSRENKLVKEYTALRDRKVKRRDAGQFVIEGARLAADAIASGATLVSAFVTDEARAKYGDCCALLDQRGMPVYDVTDAVAATLCDTKTAQGIFCIVEMPTDRLSLKTVKKTGVYLLLEDIQDPGNLGTMLRTAEATGIDGVVLSAGCTDLYSPKVVRASMGALFRLPFIAGVSLPETIGAMRTAGIRVFAALAAGGEDTLTADLSGGVAVVIGNEGNGLSPGCVAACSSAVTVRMRGRAESLNAAAAATILIWEMTRTRK
jgi:RNA methyltransferase, TrmH family